MCLLLALVQALYMYLLLLGRVFVCLIGPHLACLSKQELPCLQVRSLYHVVTKDPTFDLEVFSHAQKTTA